MKSHLNDKPTCCLPLRPQSRHSDLWYFGAQLLSLQPCCRRLAHYITVTHSRLASNAVVSSLFDRISTCRIARPLLDARSDTKVQCLTTMLSGPHFDFLVIFCSFCIYSLVPGVWHSVFPDSIRHFCHILFILRLQFSTRGLAPGIFVAVCDYKSSYRVDASTRLYFTKA